MAESNAGAPSEINCDYNSFPSIDSAMQEAYSNDAATEIYFDRNHLVYENSAVNETFPVHIPNEINHFYKELVSINPHETYELSHKHYRFAYDLVEKVLEIRGELNPDVPRNLPDLPCYLFTDEHANIIKNQFETRYQGGTDLLEEIHKITTGVYEFENFVKCRNLFAQHWQTKSYSEKSFICLCSSIAYLAAYFTQKNYYCGALDDAVKYIACWIAVILGRGTIDESYW